MVGRSKNFYYSCSGRSELCISNMEGYAKLASRMATHPELAIVRGFKAMGIQNILYLQAELQHLEIELQKCSKADMQSSNKTRQLYSRDWKTLGGSLAPSQGESSDPGDPEEGKQWKVMLRIREVLERYSKSFLGLF
jgi:hypothetical protein